jgi:hypothetical protein
MPWCSAHHCLMVTSTMAATFMERPSFEIFLGPTFASLRSQGYPGARDLNQVNLNTWNEVGEVWVPRVGSQWTKDVWILSEELWALKRKHRGSKVSAWACACVWVFIHVCVHGHITLCWASVAITQAVSWVPSGMRVSADMAPLSVVIRNCLTWRELPSPGQDPLHEVDTCKDS